MNLSLAMIVKDCAESLEKLLASVSGYFDEVVIVDTQSTDGGATEAVARKYATKFLTYERPDGFPWVDDFSAARNMSFDACTGDFICWLDSDDSAVGFEKLRACIEQAAGANKADAIFMRYDYAFDEYGNVTTQLWRERVVRRGAFKWTAPLHEVLLPVEGRRFETAKLSGIGVPYVSHKGYVGKDAPEVERRRLERNLAILDRYERTHGPLEIRMVMYRSNHLLGCGKYDEAIEGYRRYITESGWGEEIYIALLNMGRCYKGKAAAAPTEEAPALLAQALNCYRDACFSIPDHYEAHANLADVFLILGENERAEYHARQALTVKTKRFVPVENPATRDVLPIAILQKLCFQQERYAESLEWGKKLAIFLPDDKGVREMLMQCQHVLASKDVYDSFLKVRDALKEAGEDDKLRTLMKAIPADIADLGELARHMRAERPADTPSLAIYCGPSVEEWSLDSLHAGIGGSEEAVIFMAYELKKLGYHVEVYGMPPISQQGDVMGVQWLPYWCYDPEAPTDIFVAWRGHDYLRLGVGSKQRILWLHDRQADIMSPEIVALADKICVLSKSHRSDYGLSCVPEDKILYTANGIHAAWLTAPQNVAGRAVYASCPTRGLKTLLDLWPSIRAKVPHASLDVYYGFSPLYEAHARQNPALRQLKAEILEGVKQPGVTFHGKVGQKELADAFAHAAAWLYPTEFPETSCITAMRSQALGCYPVTSGYAALSETAGTWDRGPVHESESITKNPQRLKAFVEAACAALTDTDEAKRQEMATWARNRHSWAAVASQWHSHFSARPSLPPRVALEVSSVGN